MTAVQTWAAGFCVAAIGCALLQWLCPDGTLKKTFLTLTALFLFCCLIAPVKSLLASMEEWILRSSENTQVSQALSDTADEQITLLLESTLFEHAQQLLDDYGLTVRRVEIQRDKAREESIYIERIKVVLDKADYPISKDVYTLLEQTWGTVVEVYYVE